MPWTLRLLLYYSMVLMVMQLGGALLLSLFVPLQELAAGADVDYSVLLTVQAILALPVMLATRAFVQRFEGRRLASIGVRWPGGATPDLRWWGLAATAALTALGIWWLLASLTLDLEMSGWLPDEADGASWWPGGLGRLLSIFLLWIAFLAIATFEEWIYRGYLYSSLRQRLPWVHAAGVTTLFYVLLLVGGSEIAAAGIFNILLLELILAALREASGSVWTGVLFHSTWNVFLGAILSLPVSGQSMPRLWQVTVDGPVGLSGGEFGPEGSWLMTVPLLLLLALLASRLTGNETPDDAEAAGTSPEAD